LRQQKVTAGFVEKCKEYKEFPFFFSTLLLSFSAFFLCFFSQGQQPESEHLSNTFLLFTQIANDLLRLYILLSSHSSICCKSSIDSNKNTKLTTQNE
jgi:hypothetical protein